MADNKILNNIYKRIDIIVYKDTDIDEDPSNFEELATISMDFPYTIETTEDLINKIVEVVPEMAKLKNELEYIEDLDDEFSSLCGACKRDYTPIPKEEYGFQTEENYSYYLRLLVIFSHDFMNTDKCFINKDTTNADYKTIRNFLYNCDTCDRHTNCQHVELLRQKLHEITSKMSMSEIRKINKR